MMTMHNKFIQEVEESLVRECRGLSSAKTIHFLLECGLLSYTNTKAYMAHKKVEAKTKEGLPKMDAIYAVANEMGCSYATIRNYIYNNYK